MKSDSRGCLSAGSSWGSQSEVAHDPGAPCQTANVFLRQDFFFSFLYKNQLVLLRKKGHCWTVNNTEPSNPVFCGKIKMMETHTHSFSSTCWMIFLPSFWFLLKAASRDTVENSDNLFFCLWTWLVSSSFTEDQVTDIRSYSASFLLSLFQLFLLSGTFLRQ